MLSTFSAVDEWTKTLLFAPIFHKQMKQMFTGSSEFVSLGNNDDQIFLLSDETEFQHSDEVFSIFPVLLSKFFFAS